MWHLSGRDFLLHAAACALLSHRSTITQAFVLYLLYALPTLCRCPFGGGPGPNE